MVKKRIYIIMIVAMYAPLAQAQLYDGLERVCDTIAYNEKSYVRQEYIDLFVVVGNLEDPFFDVEQLMIDKSHVPEGYITRDKRAVEITNGQARALCGIVDNAFDQEQVEQIVDDHDIIIHVNISSVTGLPTGVSFTYYLNSGYEGIPISVWQNIETRIMSEFCFTITDVGKGLNHNSIVWRQCPKGRAESEPEEETESGNNNGVQTELGGVVTDRGTVGGDVGGGISGRGNNTLTPTIGGRVTP